MAVVSYAQNFEDIILWRALKHIKNGFYLDIGAFDPVNDSVSYLFYQEGWRGVNVEPVPECAEKFRKLRADETIYQCTISNSGSTTKLMCFEENGMTTASQDFAVAHRAAGYSFNEIEVDARTLESVFDDIGARDIHWMKIDVEGMEREVLASWRKHPTRPWVIVVEALKPRSWESSHFDWEFELTERGYQYVYFDGLNRFYVSNDQIELSNHFGVGPNIFDDFVLSEFTPYSADLNARLQNALGQLEVTQQCEFVDVVRSVAHTLRVETMQRFDRLEAQIQTAITLSIDEQTRLLDSLVERIHRQQDLLERLEEHLSRSLSV